MDPLRLERLRGRSGVGPLDAGRRLRPGRIAERKHSCIAWINSVMCVYVTGFIPAGDDLEGVEERLPQPLRRRLGVTFAPIDNRGMLAERPQGDRFVRFTGHRHCDCGVSMGCGIPTDLWSWWWYYGKTKGDCSLRAQGDVNLRRMHKEARQWLALLRYLAAEVGNFGLLLHDGHDLEGFISDRIERFDLASATPEAIMLLDCEVVYEVAF